MAENDDDDTLVEKAYTEIKKSNAAFVSGGLLAIIGLVFLCTCADFDKVAVFIISLAAFTTGSIIGFLFGIPRTLQKASAAEGKTEVLDNTNLEQISDWLTKILVGVGLTQMEEIKAGLYQLSLQSGIAMKGEESLGGTTIAGAVILFFALDGFLICYLWTRLMLPHIQKRNFGKEIMQQDENDKVATTTVFRQLNRSSDMEGLRTDELYEILKKASGKTISDVYIMAVNYRKNNWEHNKDCVAKTIPVFEALILLDTKNHYPENYSQLGYALKDNSHPNYIKALENFNTAISLFKKDTTTQGLGTIYFNRAICRIKIEGNFDRGMRSSDEVRSLVTADIAEAIKDTIVAKIVPNSIIANWQQLNPMI